MTTTRHELKVPAEATGQRVDLFVGERLSLSRNRLKALFEADSIRVDGRKVKKGLALAAGQVVTVELLETASGAVADTSLALTVLYEDDALVAVDKPAGVPSQPIEPGETGTVANALVARFPALSDVGADPREAGLCHRLDVETSGVLLAAKTKDAWSVMRAAFSEPGAVDKRYLALVRGPLADEGEIDLPLVHAGDHVRPALSGEEARPARSSFVVLKRAGAASLVEVRLFTGVLHQVRAHLAAVGAPILGDERYGGRPHPGLDRFFLHAASLTFTRPVSQQLVRIESPLPETLARVRDEILGRS
ncbi:MAG: RluA family pseudouridine synthase [Myxococcaceae bacterium]|nr:RluA family pseudouridine synthase [Myxococcaceae bacterium]